jgi:hypothetical protein
MPVPIRTMLIHAAMIVLPLLAPLPVAAQTSEWAGRKLTIGIHKDHGALCLRGG